MVHAKLEIICDLYNLFTYDGEVSDWVSRRGLLEVHPTPVEALVAAHHAPDRELAEGGGRRRGWPSADASWSHLEMNPGAEDVLIGPVLGAVAIPASEVVAGRCKVRNDVNWSFDVGILYKTTVLNIKILSRIHKGLGAWLVPSGTSHRQR